jgi:prophage regulatory protein
MENEARRRVQVFSSHNVEVLSAFLNKEMNEAEPLRARLLTDFTDAAIGALGEFVRNSNATQPMRYEMPRKILRLPVVLDRTGLSRSTVYQRVTEGKFPRPVSLGARAVGWIEAEVEEWIACQIEASRELCVQRAK